jgi:alkylation response protein AidB-like acyl-CoA dehydrogenase
MSGPQVNQILEGTNEIMRAIVTRGTMGTAS